MREFAELQHNKHWRMAIWALRIGYCALAVVLAGLILLATGVTPWILAIGMVAWLVAALVTATGFMWAREQLPEPRPGFLLVRALLLHDSVHALSSRGS